MKAVLIFKGGACSLLFYQRDAGFAEYLHAHPQYEMAMRDQGMNEEDFATGLLKPLLASCMSMQYVLKNSYQHLQSGKVSLVCSYYQSLTFVAVNGDGQETVDFMKRKLAALHALLRMSLGPVIETISENRHAAQQKFESLFGTWCCLINNEQCFLIEAIEKLYINQASESLSKKCVEALEDLVAKWNSSTGTPDTKPPLKIDHAALFARDKLLALYSKRRKKLSPYDLLLSIVYTLDRFPPTDWCEAEATTPLSPYKPDTAGHHRPISGISVSSNENYETSDDLPYSDRDDTSGAFAFSEVDKLSGDSTAGDLFASPSSTPRQSPVGPVNKRTFPTVVLPPSSGRDSTVRSLAIVQEPATRSLPPGLPAFDQEVHHSESSTRSPDPREPGTGGDFCAATAAADNAPLVHVDDSLEDGVVQGDPGEEFGLPVTLPSRHEQALVDVGTKVALDCNCTAKPPAIGAAHPEELPNLSSIDGGGSGSAVVCSADDVSGCNGSVDLDCSYPLAPGTDGASHVEHLHDASASARPTHSIDIKNDGNDEHINASAADPDPAVAEASTARTVTDTVPATMLQFRTEQPPDGNGDLNDADHPSGHDVPDAQRKNELEELVGSIALMADKVLTLAVPPEPSTTATRDGMMASLDSPNNDEGLGDNCKAIPTFLRPASTSHFRAVARQRESFIVERVFVKQEGYYVPKDMYIISVLPGINLILFSEDLPPRSRMARGLQVAMGNLNALLDPGSRMRLAYVQLCVQNINDEVESIVKGLRDNGSGSGSAATPAACSRCAAELAEHWQSVAGRRRELVDSLGSSLVLGRPLPNDVEQGLYDTLSDLCRIFVLLYLTTPPGTSSAPGSHAHEVTTALVESTRGFLVAEVGDFADFFVARAQRNFTMAQFQSSPFEGLFHFVFVNRTSNYMAAPSLLPDASDNSGSRCSAVARLNLFIKHRLWSNVEWIYSQLQRAGCVTSLVWDADFVFSYMLWFEDSTGTPRPVPPQPALVRMPSPIGDFDGRFYRTLMRSLFKDEDVQCCEMFGVHLGMLPESVILKQCQRLYHYVWHYIPLETEPI